MLLVYNTNAIERKESCMEKNGGLYSPSHVANFFFERGERDGIPITPLKLNKLVYIAYGWVAGAIGQRLFDEEIEAWQHGPVIRSLYDEFKHFKNRPITERSVDMPDPSQNLDELFTPAIDKIVRFCHRLNITPWRPQFRTTSRRNSLWVSMTWPCLKTYFRVF